MGKPCPIKSVSGTGAKCLYVCIRWGILFQQNLIYSYFSIALDKNDEYRLMPGSLREQRDQWSTPNEVTINKYQHAEADTKWETFAGDILKYIFLNDDHRILIPISLKFVPKDPTDNN